MKLNKLIIFSRIIIVVVLSYILFVAAINYYFMPRFIVPAVDDFIAANFSGKVKLTVEKIGFSPIKGFLLKSVALTGPIGIEEGIILKSELVDIDLDWAALFRKEIQIKMLKVIGAKLNVSRDSSGAWNFQPILEINFDNQDNDFKVFLFRSYIKNAIINYSDTYDQNNSLKRNLNNVNININNAGNDVYKIFISSHGDTRNKEDISASFIYDISRKSIVGSARFNTLYLKQYWHYYLDEIFRPWDCDAESVNANIVFSFIKDTLMLKGQYEIENGRLAYGDLSIKTNAVVSKEVNFVFDSPSDNSADISLKLRDGLVLSGENVLIRGCDSDVEISSKGVSFEKLSGSFLGVKFDLKGKYAFGEANELSLNGSIGKGQAWASLKVLGDNLGSFEVKYDSNNSFLNLKTQFTDLKNQIFNLNIDGFFDLEDMPVLQKIKMDPGLVNIPKNPSVFRLEDNFPYEFKGKLKVSANIYGELDKIASLKGDSYIRVEGLSLLGINFGSLDINSLIDRGVLSANIPKVDFYQGNLSASLKLGLKGIAAQLSLNNLDIEEFLRTRPYFADLKGVLGGNIAYSIKANNLKDFFGGGFLKLSNCNFVKLAMFFAAEDGIKSGKKDFKMPNFKIIEGNFSFNKDGISAENFRCKSDSIDLNIIGKYQYNGQAEFNLGVRLFGQNFLRIMRQIIIPYSIGFDVLTDSVYINVTGKWPNLKQKTKVQPMRFLNSFFNPDSSIKPDKYSLNVLWNKL